ncbi:hypothetical protein V7D15_07420 [Thermoanaerobacter thermohydrosulfuricus]
MKIYNLEKIERDKWYKCDMYDGEYDYAMLTKDNLFLYLGFNDSGLVKNLNTGEQLWWINNPEEFKKILIRYIPEKEYEKYMNESTNININAIEIEYENFPTWDSNEAGEEVLYEEMLKIASEIF